jgi:hypothetical protein
MKVGRPREPCGFQGWPESSGQQNSLGVRWPETRVDTAVDFIERFDNVPA